MFKKRKIAIAEIHISEKAKKYVMQTLDTNRLTSGHFTDVFEKKFAALHNRKYGIISNSGTSALQVALHALKEIYGWDDNDEIILPALTFIASPNTVLHNNLKPVFVDVEPDFYCIDPGKIEEKITPRTRAIMPVHMFGQSADMEAVIKIARKYKLKVIEDACETAFVNYKNEPVGSRGDIAVFSTYASHIIVTGVGGISLTDDHLLSETMRSLNFHGRDNIYLKIDDDDNVTDKIKLNSLIERRFHYRYIGYSYRLTEMEAALGVAELTKKDWIIRRRQQVGRDLTEILSPFRNFFQLPEVRPDSGHIYMLFPILINDSRIVKEDFLLYLEKNGVETRLFMPLLTQPIYIKIFGDIQNQFPVSEKLVDRGFIIGSHPYIKKADIKYLFNLFMKYLKYEKLLV